MHGAFHDGTRNRLHRTFRFCQKEREWLEMLQDMLLKIGDKAWIYKEGKTRNLYALETTASFLKESVTPISLQTSEEKIAYIRGYFDAEGGVPSSATSQFYVQFCQKNQLELTQLKKILDDIGINSGKVHIPSAAVDSHYFRFFVSSSSHKKFIEVINSWHPRKQAILHSRMKI